MAALSDFRARFPEFDGVGDAQVSAALADASNEIAPLIWGTVSNAVGATLFRADTGQMYLAAHYLAMSPFGQNARMVAPDGNKSTTYFEQYKRLQREVSSGFRVT